MCLSRRRVDPNCFSAPSHQTTSRSLYPALLHAFTMFSARSIELFCLRLQKLAVFKPSSPPSHITYDYPSAKERTHLSYFHRRAVKHGFDLAKYNRLKESIAEVERDLARLRDPLYQHLPATRLASLIAQSAVNHTVASSNTSSYSPPTSPRSSSSPS
uniref:Uncharacterized protein n=1 Tax=Plectus sambesii TaxID=2011161 RepID=A0A914X898_9BILA